MPKHKRGGSYMLQIMNNVTNWGGVLLDREILNNLQIEDTVRIIFEQDGSPRYVTITDVLSNGYFKGFINDPYNNRYCDICKKEGIVKGNPLYCCEASYYGFGCCDFDCHLDCLEKNPDSICKCDKSKYKIVKWKQYLLNGSIIVFKKNNISEIPNWSKNTEKLIEIYKNKLNKGYFITGYR